MTALGAASISCVIDHRLTSRSVPRYVQSMGTANSSAPVWLWSINGLNTLTSRKGTYFWGELFLNNNNALYAPLTNIALLNSGQYLGREVRTNWLPATPEVFGYDLDGNLTSDGRWNYTWDAENRLIRLVANNAVAPQQRIDFEYDWQGRRISKKVWNNTAGSGNPVTHSKFVYDGWPALHSSWSGGGNLLAEIDALNPQPGTQIRTYVWGTDLSGSLQGAGGVGGLLKLTYHGTQTTNAFVAYDGNGNVASLFDASNNALLASYEYGPFGELIRAIGPAIGSLAKLNPIRFSSKYQDDDSELVYYGYRYYNPSTGRWVSRDPIEEGGGLNLYGFVSNDPMIEVDPLGNDYYIASVDGITCIRHRVMIGDDGSGGYYWIELYPDTKNIGALKECQRRICGKGIINYLHAKGSAKEKFDELKKDKDAGAKLVKYVRTTKQQDQTLAAGAAGYGAKETTTYCFILNDCWDIEGNVKETCAQQALCKKLSDFLVKELFKIAYPNQ